MLAILPAMNRTFVIGCCLAVLMGSARVGAQHQDGGAKEAVRDGNYAVAYCIWKPLAESGDPDAQYNLGWLYHNGYGLAINDQVALELWLRAASQEHVDATFALGNLYRLGGKGVPRNLALAADYFAQAAILGEEDGSLLLETLFDNREVLELLPQLFAKMPEAFGERRYIGVGKANVRLGASTETPITATLKTGAPVRELRRKGDWVRIVIEDGARPGWVFRKLITQEAPQS